MQETPLFFHQLEWPASGARVAGPVVWLRGWVVGKPGFNFVDVRAVGSSGIHSGVLGLPRTDLALHFNSRRTWLPAEYVIGVPLPDGAANLTVEAMDESGNWHCLQMLALTVAAGGAAPARVEGDVVVQAGGSSTRRGPHLPFHGHLDDTEDPAPVRYGCTGLFGWLLHETQTIRRVFATLDGRVFNALESGLTDDSLAQKVPHLAAARQARVRGGVDAPPTLFGPACLRVYAELADGSIHLCFARRMNLSAETARNSGTTVVAPKASGKLLPPLPSARPRRMLAVVRSLQPDDATLRALDVSRHLVATTQWAVRIVASEDGPLHALFEDSGCPVQMVDPQEYYAAAHPEIARVALDKIGRQIWWRYLDGLAVFDPGSTWADQLAAQHGMPVFHDPADSLAWAAPTSIFLPDNGGALVAPIRGLAVHGASVLLRAAATLAERSLMRPIHLADVRGTTEEALFQASLEINPEMGAMWSCSDPAAVDGKTTAGSPWLQAVTGKNAFAAAGLVCSAFEAHPHRTLLAALGSGVPVITTPSRLLSAAFGANEVTFVPPGNPLALANAVTDLLGNPIARERRAAAAARIVHDRFSGARQVPHWRLLMEAAFGA